jgi:hypothetical protein
MINPIKSKGGLRFVESKRDYTQQQRAVRIVGDNTNNGGGYTQHCGLLVSAIPGYKRQYGLLVTTPTMAVGTHSIVDC